MAITLLVVKATVGHYWGMSRDDPPLRIRLPEGLKAQIQAKAAENRRSMNAEIVARLEGSLQNLRGQAVAQMADLPSPNMNERLAELEKVMMIVLTNISDINDKIGNSISE